VTSTVWPVIVNVCCVLEVVFFTVIVSPLVTVKVAGEKEKLACEIVWTEVPPEELEDPPPPP
jgi:hypothetical protein